MSSGVGEAAAGFAGSDLRSRRGELDLGWANRPPRLVFPLAAIALEARAGGCGGDRGLDRLRANVQTEGTWVTRTYTRAFERTTRFFSV